MIMTHKKLCTKFATRLLKMHTGVRGQNSAHRQRPGIWIPIFKSCQLLEKWYKKQLFFHSYPSFNLILNKAKLNKYQDVFNSVSIHKNITWQNIVPQPLPTITTYTAPTPISNVTCPSKEERKRTNLEDFFDII